MSADATLSDLSAIRLSLMAEEVRAQMAPVLRADPIAIVGMACRTPGGCETPEAFWRLLAAGIDATSSVPTDRFDAGAWHDLDPAAAGKMQATRGGFLPRIDTFDADYFSILPREAEQMDPQQRIALETAIDAINDAGALPQSLVGARASVFMASYHNDYARLVFNNPSDFDTRTLTGSVHGVVANRISHFLDWRGPSMTLDTGCSSSLVAVHLACQSLRLGESDFALAGGVSAIITPELFVAMTKVGFMAPDGRCKTFDARADGFGRGEGCGVVALKRLGDAVADGDRIHAVIRGSAVNQDGRSTVLTAPNGQAQKVLIRDALQVAAIGPERISFVEAHGTGTALGDPIEMEAIAETLGRAPGESCYVGSAKANIGHLEAAAGVIGLIKAAQVLQHRIAPPQPGFGELSPHISLDGTRLRIPTEPMPLAATAVPGCAAVSSFGIGGTNAHVVLEASPELPPSDPPQDAIWTLPLSAKTSEGVMTLAKAWLDRLDDSREPSIGDLCYTASQRRAHYPVRVAVVARTKEALRERLALALEIAPRVDTGTPKVGFVFSGQGPQWWAMGRELQRTEPVFRAAMLRCDEAISRVAGWSVIDELAKSEHETRVSQTAIAQPALFAIQTSLFALWTSWNIRPAALTGHSVGEIAALHCAGVLSLEEAARIVVNRGLIMHAATGRGRMAAVSLSQAEAEAVAARYDLNVAAVNGPRSTVLSGKAEALQAALVELRDRGVEARDMQLDYAFHSAQMNDLADDFQRTLGSVACAKATIQVFSTLSGKAVVGDELDGGNFAKAIRAPVRFADAIAAMAATGIDTFVEIGPHPVLASAIAETLERRPPRAIVASLRRGRDEGEAIRSSLAALYCIGFDPDWTVAQPEGGQVTSLPSYPWQRRRFWIAANDAATSQTLLGAPFEVAGTNKTVVGVEPEAMRRWVEDHRIFGQSVVPGTGIIQLLAAAGSAIARSRVAIEDTIIHAPLILQAEDNRWQVVGTSDGDKLNLGLHAEIGGVWRQIAEARASRPHEPAAAAMVPNGKPVDLQPFFARLADVGVAFGPGFQSLRSASVEGNKAEGHASISSHISADASPHPALLDAGLQLAMLAFGSEDAFLPIGAERATLDFAPTRSVHLRASITSRSKAAFSADVFAVSDDDGRFVAALEGVRFVKADASGFAADRAADDLYVIDWTTAAATPIPMETAWIVLQDKGGVGAAFAAAIDAAGGHALRLASGAPIQLSPAMADAALACFWPLDPTAAYDEVLALIRAYGNAGPRTFVLVVSGTCGEPSRLQPDGQRSAGIAALANIAALEHPDLHLRIIDIDPLASQEQQVRAVLKVLGSQREPVVSLGADDLRVPRMRRPTRGKSGAMRVVQGGDGLDGVLLQPFTPAPPGPGELRVRVRAAGINFRDTLVALGVYPGTPAPFGAECAGVVDAIGTGVTQFACGDRVVGLAPASMASHVSMQADLAVTMPDGMRFDMAAALPVASVTVHIAFRQFADLKAGNRVLIHGATGGVGLAAIALARRIGAEVFATAGSHEKRAFLRRMGVEHVFDSRTLDFADEILTATKGSGVHVALNSLTGGFVEATLRTLAPAGTLVELGKRDIWTADEIAAVRPDVRYSVFDAGVMAEAEPALLRDAMCDVLAALVRRDMPYPPVEVRPLRDVAAALRRMAGARHIGKLVLTLDPQVGDAVPVHAGADYLITGGFGGVGLQAAAWLVDRGARRIILAGRNAPEAHARAAIAELERAGATIRSLQIDISNAELLRELMVEIGPSLRGIFHAAGVPANGLVLDLDAAAINAASRGKVEGARLLRETTRDATLDFVVLCSSVAGLFGGQGQGAYAAANAELERIAQEWRSDGVNVASVAWGPWSEGGMFASSSQGVQAAWRARGLIPMKAARAFMTLQRALASEAGHVIVADIDWTQALQPLGTVPPLFEEMLPRADSKQAPTEAAVALAELRMLAPSLQRSDLLKLLASRVRTLLELPRDYVLPPTTPLKDVGLDSLMAVELRNLLARLGDTPLPATLVFDHPTLDALADRLSIIWNLASSSAPIAAGTSVFSIDEISDDEAEALLNEELQLLSAGGVK